MRSVFVSSHFLQFMSFYSSSLRIFSILIRRYLCSNAIGLSRFSFYSFIAIDLFCFTTFLFSGNFFRDHWYSYWNLTTSISFMKYSSKMFQYFLHPIKPVFLIHFYTTLLQYNHTSIHSICRDHLRVRLSDCLLALIPSSCSSPPLLFSPLDRSIRCDRLYASLSEGKRDGEERRSVVLALLRTRKTMVVSLILL